MHQGDVVEARGFGNMRPRRTREDAAIEGSQSATHVSRLAVVGALTAAIAHEIHQPLGAILANAETGDLLCERACKGDATALSTLRNVLADVRRDALRASGVIRDVRALAGQRAPACEVFDANALAFATVRLLDADLRRRRLRIEVAPLSGDAALHGDRAQIERVLINLLCNAMDATATCAPPRPPIALRLSRARSGALEIAVADAGPGLPAARLAELFRSFHTTKPHGMGLGLSIARSIVEAHGGTIRAENNRGAGATFRVTLPNG